MVSSTESVKTVGKYMAQIPLTFTADEQPELYAEVMARIADDWRESLAVAGGAPLEEPSVRTMENPDYGRPLYDSQDQPVLAADGRHITDVVKLYVIASGRATRP